jgi:acetyl-CoA carboxylase carboxyl transferase subunit beta
MGLFSWKKPKIKIQSAKPDGFSGWIKCSGCHEMVHASELQESLYLCPKCQHHYRMPLQDRLALLTDQFEELFTHILPKDPLKFKDKEAYKDRLKKAQQSSQRDEAICVGEAMLHDKKIALAIMDFSFMGGSMGSVVGERLTLLIEHATKHLLPLVIVTSSGGARMQESTLSLMQMAKTSAALRLLGENRIPYISVLTNPTTGGVTASFASLGDIIIAEPDALVAFAGPRVVEQTIGHKLPPKAQRSEFLLDKGMVDVIVSREHLKEKIYSFLDFLSNHMGKNKSESISMRLKQLLSYTKHETKA